MGFVYFSIVLLLTFFIGTFGFAQIVGVLKFFGRFRFGSAAFTIIFWGIILGFIAFAIIKWFNNYTTALYIGYGISFILSLGTKPDWLLGATNNEK